MKVFTNVVAITRRGNGPFDICPLHGQVYKTVPCSARDYVVVDRKLYILDDKALVKPDITGFRVID